MTWTADEIRNDAMRETGLSDFGDAPLEAPLDLLTQATQQPGVLSGLGVQLMRRLITDNLTSRLKVVAGLKRTPEALNHPIRRPIFILGFPRTGTTTLHNMMAAMRGVQVLEHWIALNPKNRPPESEWDADADHIRVADALRAQYAANPELKAQHDISADSADECRYLLQHLLTDDTYGYLCDLPAYWEWLDRTPMRDAYLWHRRALQLIQYPHAVNQRWVVKYPSHMAWIDTLFEVYPDACIIQTHRDPAKAIPSFASLIHGVSQAFAGERSEHAFGRFLADQWHGRIENYMATRARIGRADQFHDVQFAEVLADPAGAVARACDRFGIEIGAGERARMEGWIAAHPSGRHGAHRYSADMFGLDPDELSARFATYRARFDVPEER